jgi:LPXTG-site transpeptidase (sortase) family protein
MPLRAGTDREAPPQPSTTPESRAARRRRRKRQLVRQRVVTLACLIGALVALGAGVHFLTAPTRTAENPPAGKVDAPRVETVAVSKAAASKITYARPARLIIPKIGLEAAVEAVGLTAENAMASPSGPDTVGWYKLGPRPGNKGSAVIDGHSGYASGEAAAFDRLTELSKGDRLFVEDASGRRASFTVRKTQLFARDANAAAVFAPTASRRLNLITCTGSFDVAAGTHSQRLVVFADLEVPQQVTPQQ